MERAQYKTTNGGSRRATPDAPERIDHPRRCTGHGRRTPDGGSARERVLERVPTYRATRAETRREVQRRTRRSALAIQGAAQDTAVGRPAAHRAGARPTPRAPATKGGQMVNNGRVAAVGTGG